MSDSQLYVIGKRGSGVLFVRTSPLRAAMVSAKTIKQYEDKHPGVDGYARVAVAARSMMAEQDGNPDTFIDEIQAQGIEAVIAGGAVLSEADFAFIGQVVDAGWDSNRKSQMPIEDVLRAISPSEGAEGQLVDALLDRKSVV